MLHNDKVTMYLNLGKWAEDMFVDRLQLLIVGNNSGTEPFKVDNRTWALHGDWRVTVYQNNMAQVKYRYPDRMRAHQWVALDVTVNLLMRLDPLTEEQKQSLSGPGGDWNL